MAFISMFMLVAISRLFEALGSATVDLDFRHVENSALLIKIKKKQRPDLTVFQQLSCIQVNSELALFLALFRG
jgi:hypothetical protein